MSGPWTRHGHPVPGVTVVGDAEERPPRARCGGPALCSQCSKDAERIRHEARGDRTASDDDLDVLARARDRLSELVEQSDAIDPTPWSVDLVDHEVAVLSESAGGSVAFDMGDGTSALSPPTADLIVALRACVPYVIGRLDAAIRDHRATGLWKELDLARAILEATERTGS